MSRGFSVSRKSKNVNDYLNQKQLQERLCYQEDFSAKLEKQNSELKKEVAILTKEKNELLNRLSRFAGEQLTRGNPNIADLSDPNRPTKVAEKWNLLYTDEWLDAYEEFHGNKRRSLTHPPEKHLLDIVVLCFTECQKTATEQILQLKTTLEDLENYMLDNNYVSGTDCTQSRRISSAKFNHENNARFIDEIINAYRRRRRTDQGWVNAIAKKCANQYIKERGIHSRRVLSYVNKCAELCWYMCVNDPPMVIEYESYPGQEIDQSKFNLYNGKGTIVDFIVWPALFLNRGDSLSILAKGTVQTVMVQPTTSSHLPKRKSSERMDNMLIQGSMQKRDMRVSSAASMRSSTKQSSLKSAMKRSNNSSVVVHDQSPEVSFSEANGDFKNKTDSIHHKPRIVNPEKLLSHKPIHQQITSKSQRKNNFSKSFKGGSFLQV